MHFIRYFFFLFFFSFFFFCSIIFFHSSIWSLSQSLFLFDSNFNLGEQFFFCGFSYLWCAQIYIACAARVHLAHCVTVLLIVCGKRFKFTLEIMVTVVAMLSPLLCCTQLWPHTFSTGNSVRVLFRLKCKWI